MCGFCKKTWGGGGAEGHFGGKMSWIFGGGLVIHISYTVSNRRKKILIFYDLAQFPNEHGQI